MMNILDINKRIKQRPPFQMVERVTELRPGEYAKGIKNAIRQAKLCVANDLCGTMEKALAEVAAQKKEADA